MSYFTHQLHSPEDDPMIETLSCQPPVLFRTNTTQTRKPHLIKIYCFFTPPLLQTYSEVSNKSHVENVESPKFAWRWLSDIQISLVSICEKWGQRCGKCWWLWCSWLKSADTVWFFSQQVNTLFWKFSKWKEQVKVEWAELLHQQKLPLIQVQRNC